VPRPSRSRRRAKGDEPAALRDPLLPRQSLTSRGRIGECRTEHDAALAGALRAGDPMEARAVSGLADAGPTCRADAHRARPFPAAALPCAGERLRSHRIANRVMIWSFSDISNEFDAGLRICAKVWRRIRVAIATPRCSPASRPAPAADIAPRYAAAAWSKPSALEQARALGRGRYEAVILAHSAESTLARRSYAARELARQGRSRCRGRPAPASAARLRSASSPGGDDPDERARRCARVRAILAGGCVSHNHFWFHRNAIGCARGR